MAMQQSQTGSVFCSFYIHCRHQHEENHYTMEAAVGSVRSGNLESLKKGVQLVKLNGKDLLGVTSEDFLREMGIVPESGNRQLSLTIENHGAAVDLPQEDSCDTTEETLLIVTLQDAEIELLCTDCGDECTLDGTYPFATLWQCKSMRLVNDANQYVGWTASGPGFSDTEENIIMVEMDKHVFLQFPATWKFLKCEKKEGTFTLKAEENDALKRLLSAISQKKALKDMTKIFEDNKSFFFHLTPKKERHIYTFQSALCHNQFICATSKKLGVKNVPGETEIDSYFRVEAKKTKIK
ncbi:uncharacterized protein LOC134071194 isoform X2 [Sardina pilchardus]|uniref:uncharacterized protein LOC134071194 isoform X2 n=1 Tax=Sardina pilchardus TaxID=27697 RepID=UPI002E1437AB